MGIWEIDSPALGISSNPFYKTSSKGVASEYSKILDEKISNAKAEIEQMREIQGQLNEISELHAELTGSVKVNEDSGNANGDGGSVSNPVEVETIKRFMPDGSIMVTTYENGKITEQVRHKPHMIAAPDYTAPPKPDGSPAIELKPYQNFDLEMLLMI